MTRRIAVLAFLASSALVANAQLNSAPRTASPPTVGIIAMGGDSVFRELPTWARLFARMRELGWRDGENIYYMPRGAAGDPAKLDAIMQEMLRARVTVILAVATQEVLAAKRATGAIPIVMIHPFDPVELGVVTSLSRPEANITGNSATASGMAGKRIELLTELFPGTKRLLLGYDASSSRSDATEIVDSAQKRGLKLTRSDLPASGEYDGWAAKARREGANAAIVPHVASAFPPARRKALAEALLKHRLPAICGTSEYVDSGCLASYSASNIEFFASSAAYVDKILRGAKPGDLPIQQPTLFELVINRKTAKVLGITIPQSVLLRADRVIE